jgi:polysaccharide export outer membrane protein
MEPFPRLTLGQDRSRHMNRVISVGVCILASLLCSTAAAQEPAKTDSVNKSLSNTQATVAAQVPAAPNGDVDAAQKSPAKSVPSLDTDRSAPIANAKVGDRSSAATLAKGSTAAPVSVEASLTAIYRVGVGDVIDIRVRDLATSGSTLFTVLEGGFIDFPVIGGTVAVAGLTTDEIQAQLAAEFKRRALQDEAKVTVGVRQYASHTVIVTGLVVSGGSKILRREAVPLYVLMAESQSRLDAARVAIMRAGNPVVTLDLTEPASSSILIRPGDVINVTARPEQFYYIGGHINYPGQKVFQPGITLLQCILAAGGLRNQSDGIVEMSREGTGGNLTTKQYRLKDIKSGRVPDPRLQSGDRIEVIR